MGGVQLDILMITHMEALKDGATSQLRFGQPYPLAKVAPRSAARKPVAVL